MLKYALSVCLREKTREFSSYSFLMCGQIAVVHKPRFKSWTYNTFTLSKVTGQVEAALIPSLSSFFPTWSPSVSRSTTKHVIPLYPWGELKRIKNWFSYKYPSKSTTYIQTGGKPDTCRFSSLIFYRTYFTTGYFLAFCFAFYQQQLVSQIRKVGKT